MKPVKEWMIIYVDGYYRFVNHEERLLTTGFGSPGALQRNADIISTRLSSLEVMRSRYASILANLETQQAEAQPNKDWTACTRASNRLADLVCAMYHPKDEKARQTWPTATWAEIIANELGIEVPETL